MKSNSSLPFNIKYINTSKQWKIVVSDFVKEEAFCPDPGDAASAGPEHHRSPFGFPMFKGRDHLSRALRFPLPKSGNIFFLAALALAALLSMGEWVSGLWRSQLSNSSHIRLSVVFQTHVKPHDWPHDWRHDWQLCDVDRQCLPMSSNVFQTALWMTLSLTFPAYRYGIHSNCGWMIRLVLVSLVPDLHISFKFKSYLLSEVS